MENRNIEMQKRQGEQFLALKSQVFNSWLNRVRQDFKKSEVRHIGPYKDIKGEVSIRVIYNKDTKPVFFTIPSNLDLTRSDWEYLESQIRENIPQYVA